MNWLQNMTMIQIVTKIIMTAPNIIMIMQRKEEFTANQNNKKNGNIDLNQNEKNEKGINNNQKNDTKDGEFDGPYIYTDDSVSMIR